MRISFALKEASAKFDEIMKTSIEQNVYLEDENGRCRARVISPNDYQIKLADIKSLQDEVNRDCVSKRTQKKTDTHQYQYSLRKLTEEDARNIFHAIHDEAFLNTIVITRQGTAIAVVMHESHYYSMIDHWFHLQFDYAPILNEAIQELEKCLPDV